MEEVGDTKPSNNTLYKTKHSKSNILSYRVGLDPVATLYLVEWIEKSQNKKVFLSQKTKAIVFVATEVEHTVMSTLLYVYAYLYAR